jgi:hypothetical protein
MVIKVCDVFSYVANANVGHSDNNFMFDNTHRCTHLEGGRENVNSSN